MCEYSKELSIMSNDELLNEIARIDKQIAEKSYEKYVKYGLVDVQLLAEIESVKNLIRMVVTVAYLDKTNFIDAFSQVRMWDVRCMNFIKHEYNIIGPYLIAKENDDYIETDDKFEGAFVYQPKPNRYDWIMSDDVQSMHPSIIMAFNISPETYLGNSKKNVEFFLKDNVKHTQELIDNNASCLANGAMFDRSYEGFMPRLVRIVFDMRITAKNEAKKYKKLKEEIEKQLKDGDTLELREQYKEYSNRYVEFDTLQNALKVKINAFFGFLGNQYSRFFQLDMAEGITLTSQVMLKSGAEEIIDIIKKTTDTKDDILLYGDTDSVDGSSLVYKNGEQIAIKSLYEQFSNFEYKDDFNRNYVKTVEDTYTKSMNMVTGEIEDKKIKYVMKHRVKKMMYRISFENNYVDITEDHSIIVKRNGRYMSVSPPELDQTKDKIIKILNNSI